MQGDINYSLFLDCTNFISPKLLLKYDMLTGSVKKVTKLQNWDYFTELWGCWKPPFGIPGVRPMFLKAELHEKYKYGLKTINYRHSPVLFFFFKKLFSAQKKSSKKSNVLLIFEFFCQYKCISKTNSEKLNAGLSESVVNHVFEIQKSLM